VLKLTLRGLRSHTLRLVSTLLAVVLGVGFMVGTQVLGATVKTSFDEIFADVNADIDAVVRSNVEIEGPFESARPTVDEALAQQVAAVPGVAAAEGSIVQTVRLIDREGDPIGNPSAGPPTFLINWLVSPELNGWDLVEGRAPSGPGELVLDRGSADDEDVAVGDPLTVGVPSGPVELTVVGIARFGELDDFAGSSAVLVDLPTAQALVGETGAVGQVIAAGAPDRSQDEVVAAITDALARQPGLDVISGADFTEESADPFREFVDDFTLFITVFGFIALFVGGFIIFNTFTVILAQRTRELALLRAIGASRRQVLGSVVVEAFVVGTLAAAIGAVLGFGLALGLRWVMARLGFDLPDTPLVIEAGGVLVPVVIAVAITVASAAVPARRASRVSPMAALGGAAVDRSGTSRLRLVAGGLLALVTAAVFVDGLGRSGQPALLRIGFALASSFVLTVVLGPLYIRPAAAVLGEPLARLTTVTGHLSRQNARRNPTRTATTTAALTIAVGLVTVIAIAAASVTESINRATEQAFAGDLVVRGDSFEGVPAQVARDIDALDEVAVATGFRGGLAEVQGAGRLLVAIDPARATQVVDFGVEQGSLADMSPRGIALSSEEAERNAVALGDFLVVRFLNGNQVVLDVEAIFADLPLQSGPASGVIITQETFDTGFPPSLLVDQQVVVDLADGVDGTAARRAVEAVVERYPTAQVLDVGELKDQQAGQINQAVSFLYALLFLSVLVALIGVVNTLLLAVFERTRELGLLRAVGTTRRQVRGIILGESVIIAVLGTTLGVGIGILFGWALVSGLAADEPDLAHFAIPWGQVVLTMGIAVLAGIAAGALPARRAARLDVLAAIATE
jgi:putative ABC transport system permease protein